MEYDAPLREVGRCPSRRQGPVGVIDLSLSSITHNKQMHDFFCYVFTNETMNKEQLLQRIQEICYNTEDAITLDDWASLTYQQLRAVVTLLDNGGAAMITDATPSNGRGHCFILKNLATYLQRNPSATNPITRRPVTQTQRDLVQAAYRRLVPRRQSAASIGAASGRFVNFGPGTILQINGVRRTTDTGSLVITTTRSFGRDVIVVNINYPN
jgi:hypothetical protein